MAGHNDPRLLYSIPGIKAYHLQDGEESSLTPSGPQTLSLLMVPTSHSSGISPTLPLHNTEDQDFYLHLNLPPELDLPMPATTQIYHQPPHSYLIPRWDLGPDSGAFTRIEFPPIGHGPGKATQEDIDTFETILAQCTAFLERAQPPSSKERLEQYNPADYAPGGRYANSTGHGQIVLVDEDDGSVVGELGEGATVHEDPALRHGTKNPVEIQISADGQRVDVRPISEEYLALSRHPAYKDSGLVQNAAAASRLIVTGSSYIGNYLTSGADSFVQKTKPNTKPVEFKPATHDRVRKINSLTQNALGLSNKTVGSASKIAQNLGSKLTARGPAKPKAGFDQHGRPVDSYKPGLLNRSMIAFTTIADGIAYSGQNLLSSTGTAATTVVGHKYGAEAGSITSDLAGGVKNVGLVYIDVTGVSRKAVIKSVAKGMVVGKVRGGGQVMVGGGDGGVLPEQDIKQSGLGQGPSHGQGQSAYPPSKGPAGQPGYGSANYSQQPSQGVGEGGFGNVSHPSQPSQGGGNLGSSDLKGQYAPPPYKQ